MYWVKICQKTPKYINLSVASSIHFKKFFDNRFIKIIYPAEEIHIFKNNKAYDEVFKFCEKQEEQEKQETRNNNSRMFGPFG